MPAILKWIAASLVIAVLCSGAAKGQGFASVPPEPGANPSGVQIPPYRLSVSPDGRTLTISGGIRFGLERDVAAALAAAPGVRTVVLASPGGRLGPADDVAQMVRRRGLDTYVASQCSSICTEIFAAGRHRTLGRGARLGFHGASLGAGAPSQAVSAVNRQMMDRYVAAGVDRGFIERAASVSPRGIWFPTVSQLRAANVITAVAGR